MRLVVKYSKKNNIYYFKYIISKRDKQRAKEKAAELELANQKRDNDESGRQNESFHHEHVNTVSERVKSASGTVVTGTFGFFIFFIENMF